MGGQHIHNMARRGSRIVLLFGRHGHPVIVRSKGCNLGQGILCLDYHVQVCLVWHDSRIGLWLDPTSYPFLEAVTIDGSTRPRGFGPKLLFVFSSVKSKHPIPKRIICDPSGHTLTGNEVPDYLCGRLKP